MHVACILRGADDILPATGGGYELGGLASLLRDWAGEAPFCNLPFTSLLIADHLNDLHPSVALNPRTRAHRGAAAADRGPERSAHAAAARLPAAFEALTRG